MKGVPNPAHCVARGLMPKWTIVSGAARVASALMLGCLKIIRQRYRLPRSGLGGSGKVVRQMLQGIAFQAIGLGMVFRRHVASGDPAVPRPKPVSEASQDDPRAFRTDDAASRASGHPAVPGAADSAWLSLNRSAPRMAYA
jgi:hypothetical protein